MSLTAIVYLLVIATCVLLCMFRSPFWGIILCLLVYFLNPTEHWWGAEFPQVRWGLIAIGITCISSLINKHKLNDISVFATKYRILTIFFVLTCVVSLFAIDIQASLDRCYYLFTYLIFSYLLIRSINDDRELIILIFAILILGAALGLEAYTTPRHGGRLEGVGPSDANDANNLALLLASIVPLGIPGFFAARKLWTKITVIVCMAFIVNGIILANSRGAVLALAVACISILLMGGSWHFRKQMLVLLFVGAGGFLYLADETFVNRFQTITDTETDRGAGRLDIWSYGLQIAKDHPFGVGGDGFRRLSRTYLPEQFLSETGERVPHNTYLLILTEQGIVGLCLYLAVILSCFRDLRAKAKYFRDKLGFDYMLALGVMASLVCHVIGSFFGDRLYYQFIYVLLSLAIIITHKEQSQNAI